LHKLSSRARLRAAILAVCAAALTVAVGGGVSGADTGTGTGENPTISMELVKGKLKFVAPETVYRGEQLEIVNKTNPRQVGPHTFSLVTKASLPKTRKAQNACFAPKRICLEIAEWHGFNPKTERITVNLVKVGLAGWSTMGSTSKKGDSWYSGEKKGASIAKKVSAQPGTLYFICAVHPEMQGEVEVKAPPAPVPAT
jgi:F0F1-type ATP synthase membrane subunit c/vacuolar-type H+-ATPase subunit K